MICCVAEDKEKTKFLLGLIPMNMIKLAIELSMTINPGGNYESH